MIEKKRQRNLEISESLYAEYQLNLTHPPIDRAHFSRIVSYVIEKTEVKYDLSEDELISFLDSVLKYMTRGNILRTFSEIRSGIDFLLGVKFSILAGRERASDVFDDSAENESPVDTPVLTPPPLPQQPANPVASVTPSSEDPDAHLEKIIENYRGKMINLEFPPHLVNEAKERIIEALCTPGSNQDKIEQFGISLAVSKSDHPSYKSYFENLLSAFKNVFNYKMKGIRFIPENVFTQTKADTVFDATPITPTSNNPEVQQQVLKGVVHTAVPDDSDDANSDDEVEELTGEDVVHTADHQAVTLDDTPLASPQATPEAQGSQAASVPAESKEVVSFEKSVAIGDLHGSLQAYYHNLKAANIIDESGNWIAGNTKCVFLGDILADRTAQGFDILKRIDDLRKQAKAAGGEVVVLAGNHDDFMLQYLMSALMLYSDNHAKNAHKMCQDDLQGLGLIELLQFLPEELHYDPIPNFSQLEDTLEYGPFFNKLNPKDFPGIQKSVLKAMQNSEEGQFLLNQMCQMKLCEIQDDTLFVHTDPTPKMLITILKDGVEKVNDRFSSILTDAFFNNKAPHTKELHFIRTFLATENRTFVDDPFIYNFHTDKLRSKGIKTVVFGHSNFARASADQKLKIDGVTFVGADLSAFKGGKDNGEASVALIEKDGIYLGINEVRNKIGSALNSSATPGLPNVDHLQLEEALNEDVTKPIFENGNLTLHKGVHHHDFDAVLDNMKLYYQQNPGADLTIFVPQDFLNTLGSSPSIQSGANASLPGYSDIVCIFLDMYHSLINNLSSVKFEPIADSEPLPRLHTAPLVPNSTQALQNDEHASPTFIEGPLNNSSFYSRQDGKLTLLDLPHDGYITVAHCEEIVSHLVEDSHESLTVVVPRDIYVTYLFNKSNTPIPRALFKEMKEDFPQHKSIIGILSKLYNMLAIQNKFFNFELSVFS